MIKQHKKMLILTSVITLLPIFIGLLLWRQLPASVATHFGVDNQPDGYCSKAFAVFGLPVMMLFFHFICIVATNIDPKRKNISKKVFRVVMWICPVISLVNCNILYVYNLGYKLNIGFVCGLLVGILYLILGNFIPKVKPNYSIGFRIPWALNVLGQQELCAEALCLLPHCVRQFSAAGFCYAGIVHDLIRDSDLAAEMLLLHHQHAIACPGKIKGRRKSGRPSTYHDYIIELFHLHYSMPTRSRLGLRVSAPGCHLAGQTWSPCSATNWLA